MAKPAGQCMRNVRKAGKRPVRPIFPSAVLGYLYTPLIPSSAVYPTIHSDCSFANWLSLFVTLPMEKSATSEIPRRPATMVP